MGLCVKPMEGQELLSFLSEEAEKVTRCFTNVFSDVIFLSPAYCNSLGY